MTKQPQQQPLFAASAMAAVRSLRVSVKSDSGSDRSESDSDSESDRDAREAEPMEVEEGELEAEDISVNRSLKELLPVSVWTRPRQTGDWRLLRPAEPREVSACGNFDSRLSLRDGVVNTVAVTGLTVNRFNTNWF